MSQAPDLASQPPRSPKVRVGGYVILGRTLDKCRASIAGKLGEYHFDCPLDRMLFGFKGVTGDDFKEQVERGANDDEMAEWMHAHGEKKTPEEIREWSDGMERYSMYDDPEKQDFFVEECEKVGLDPKRTTMFDWLETDDRATFGGA